MKGLFADLLVIVEDRAVIMRDPFKICSKIKIPDFHGIILG